MSQTTLTEKIEKRQECNRQILRRLAAFVEANPSLRFHQVLSTMNITETVTVGKEPNVAVYCKDKFYEESTETLLNLKNG